jgi:hypothetical protein
MKQSYIRVGDIRIPEQQQLVTAAPTPYGLGFRRTNTFCKALGFYFRSIKPQVHIMSEPDAIIILVQRPFSTNGAATPYFGRVSY